MIWKTLEKWLFSTKWEQLLIQVYKLSRGKISYEIMNFLIILVKKNFSQSTRFVAVNEMAGDPCWSQEWAGEGLSVTQGSVPGSRIQHLLSQHSSLARIQDHAPCTFRNTSPSWNSQNFKNKHIYTYLWSSFKQHWAAFSMLLPECDVCLFSAKLLNK